MFKVSDGKDPYNAIGKYIRDHITAIEDMIAVIRINEVETNQLFTVDMNEENYFIWKNDWWEGEEDVILIDFFPVSEAQRANQSVQSADTISRQAAIDAANEWLLDCLNVQKQDRSCGLIRRLEDLPSVQPERKTAKWIATTSLQEGQITWKDYKCSNCSHHRRKPMNFCEVCGRKMER